MFISAMGAGKAKLVAILALPGVQMLDVSGPLDVFAEANAQAGDTLYHLRVLAPSAGPLRSSSGMRLIPDFTFDEMDVKSIHTLLLAGCPDLASRAIDDRLIGWLQATAPRTKRFGSVCSGALLLAKAGLLNGKRATSHWSVIDKLRADYPDVIVDADAIYVTDGKVRTSAGVTAGLDLALSLVEEDLGVDIAKSISNQLVMYFKRTGGQLQFSRKGETKPAGRSALQELQRYVEANLSDDHSIPNLASRLDLSERHFARMFRHEIGVTPAVWVERVRIESARNLLELGNTPKQVATACGFADADVLRRAFVRNFGVTPAAYRKVFVGT